MVASRAIERILGVLTAAALGVDAGVHFANAGSYESVTTSVVSQATLFRAQAAAAVVIAVVLLVRPRLVAWVLAVIVAAAALGAVLLALAGTALSLWHRAADRATAAAAPLSSPRPAA